MSFPFTGIDMKDIVEFLDKTQRGGGRTVEIHQAHPLKRDLLQKFESLGWDPAFLERIFRNLRDDQLGEWVAWMFIEQWAKHALLRIRDTSGFLEAFVSIGLLPATARRLERVCAPLLDSSYTIHQIRDVAIEHLIGKYRPVGLPTATHIMSPEVVNEWFYDADLRTNLMNIPFKCSVEKSREVEALLRRLTSHDPVTSDLHFHTTSWKGCVSIMTEIDNKLGRTCLDFGTKPGFYCSQKIEDSLQLGVKLSHAAYEEIAIIVFSLPNEFPPTLSVKRLLDDEWRLVTGKSRRCSDPTIELPELRGYDMVFGNMVANANRAHNGETPVTHRPPKTQLCSKKERGDSFLQEHIVGILYFQKHVPRRRATRRAARSRRRDQPAADC
jgi:hypothetical protein